MLGRDWFSGICVPFRSFFPLHLHGLPVQSDTLVAEGLSLFVNAVGREDYQREAPGMRHSQRWPKGSLSSCWDSCASLVRSCLEGCPQPLLQGRGGCWGRERGEGHCGDNMVIRAMVYSVLTLHPDWLGILQACILEFHTCSNSVRLVLICWRFYR